MTSKAQFEQLFKDVYDLHLRTLEVMEGVKRSIDTVNDEQHAVTEAVRQNSEVLDRSNTVISLLRQSMEMWNKRLFLLLLLLASAVVVLAGAEKALKFISMF